MAFFTTTTSTVTALLAILGATTTYLQRRRKSKTWIDVRHKEVDLSGKTIIITGGNVGLGYETAKDLARRNANVVIACRDVQKGEAAVQSISKDTKNGNIGCLPLDLASIASVKDFISQVQSKYESIDVLILNAGVWMPMENKVKTKDGYEIHFGVNHLAHHLIAKSLVPQLEQSDNNDGRIIFVSSSLMTQGRIDLQEATIHEGRSVDEEARKSFVPVGYCDSKLMNALTCKYMASTFLPSTVSNNNMNMKITTYSVCPGFCRTTLGRNTSMPFIAKLLFGPIMLMIQRTQTQGAQNIIFATITKKQELVSGSMYRDGQIMTKEMDYMESIGGDIVAKEVWDVSEALLEKH